MKLGKILEDFAEIGVRLESEDGRLFYKPASKVKPEDLEVLRDHKAELIELLRWDKDVAFSLIGEALAYVAERYQGENTDDLDEPGEQIDDAFRGGNMHALHVAVRHYVLKACALFGSREGRAA